MTGRPLDTAAHAADLQRALAGEPAAREALGQRLGCLESFVRTIHRRCGRPLEPTECEDIAQDARTRVLLSLHQFRGASKLESWCFQVCRGCVLNVLRAEGRRAKGETLQSEPEARAERMFELAEEYQAALDRLGPPDDTIVRMRVVDELEFVAIGRSLSMHPGTVKTRYRRALERLARLIPSREEPAQ